MSSGSVKFLLGLAIGATTGFTAGYFTATPTARTAGSAALGGLGTSLRLAGRAAHRASGELGTALEAVYTRVRGREKYLEHQIEELREQITRLEQKVE
ncbi:hypothetical protein E0L93_00975 [Rubrobacter taiwanensis]|uniref:Uncharacterized protein n=1 Tax=Rubrobacter taiwanensis TaxID=185139 RepID=A0A4R1BTK2_9ACTN|nr:hypothetical protein [Rubrobacter taiwanensis]TCJ20616.1 hypothetical protein E0L93_00975 [Rubrobacter taiwanensis]